MQPFVPSARIIQLAPGQLPPPGAQFVGAQVISPVTMMPSMAIPMSAPPPAYEDEDKSAATMMRQLAPAMSSTPKVDKAGMMSPPSAPAPTPAPAPVPAPGPAPHPAADFMNRLASGSASSSMQIFIKMVNGKVFALDVDSKETVESVKQKIRAKEGVAIETQHLIFAGKQMQDKQTLAECNVGKACTIHVVVPATVFPELTGMEKEPMLLLDITGSMNYGTSSSDPTPRKQTVREAISLIVSTLEKHDSQADKEDDGGGLRTVTFSAGDAHDVGDINSKNLAEKWASIRFRGGTWIVPGWKKLMEVYNDEFGSKPADDRPVLMALVITDGEADDKKDFEELLRKLPGSNIYVVFAVIGYGGEHDDAVKSLKAIQVGNKHVHVMPFDSESDPQKIAHALLKMVE